MKKTALLIIALAFALTGCASMEGEKETSPIQTETIVSTDNAPAQTTETENGTAENVAGIFDVLNTLEYQPYTCDGLPEYLLTAADGTVYSINFSEKWIWRGNSEQAELSDELIARLKEDKNLTQAENIPVETNKPNMEIPTEATAPVDNPQSPIAEPKDDTTENVTGMTGIFDALNKLEYQPYTCDGLPEYRLLATDGTVYFINFSENWVWRGNSEQAELPDELVSQLKESGMLIAEEKSLEPVIDK